MKDLYLTLTPYICSSRLCHPDVGGSVSRLSVLDIASPTLHTCAPSLCMCCSDITPSTAWLACTLGHWTSVKYVLLVPTSGGCLTTVDLFWRLFTCSPFAQPHVLLCITSFTPCSPGLRYVWLLLLAPLQASGFTCPQLCFSARHIGQALAGAVNRHPACNLSTTLRARPCTPPLTLPVQDLQKPVSYMLRVQRVQRLHRPPAGFEDGKEHCQWPTITASSLLWRFRIF